MNALTMLGIPLGTRKYELRSFTNRAKPAGVLETLCKLELSSDLEHFFSGGGGGPRPLSNHIVQASHEPPADLKTGATVEKIGNKELNEHWRVVHVY